MKIAKQIDENLLSSLESSREIESKLSKQLLSEKNRDYAKAYDIFYAKIDDVAKGYQLNEALFFRNPFLGKIFSLLPPIDYTFLRYVRRLINTIGAPANFKILEVGGGDALLSIALSKRGNNVVCTDVSNVALKFAHQNIAKFKKRVSLKKMDGRDLNFPDNHFDLVVSGDFLEHLHEDDVLPHFKEAFRVLKKQGAYLISTPNGVYYKPGGFHLRTYTYSDIEKVLGENLTIKSPLFNFFPFILRFEFVFKARKILESLFLRFKIPKIIGQIAGIDPILVEFVKK